MSAVTRPNAPPLQVRLTSPEGRDGLGARGVQAPVLLPGQSTRSMAAMEEEQEARAAMKTMRRRTRGLMTQSLAWPGQKCCRQINQSNKVVYPSYLTFSNSPHKFFKLGWANIFDLLRVMGP